jgi:Domain of unknown function (DUF4136)
LTRTRATGIGNFDANRGEKAFMRQEFGKWTARIGPALIFALIAYSVTYAQDVRTNYRPGTDFSKYHTYAWVNEINGVPAVGGQADQILDSQIKYAIDSQMTAKGFTKVNSSNPDLVIGYQIAINQEKQINGYGSGGWRGWGWGPWGGGLDSFSASTSTINVGTFVLGMYDPAAKQLVWIGAAQHAIDPPKQQDKHQKNLNKGAQKLLKDFPPGRK